MLQPVKTHCDQYVVEGIPMKRRCVIKNAAVLVAGSCLAGCTVVWEDQGAQNNQKKAPTRSGTDVRSRRPSRQSGPTDINALSKLLQKAGYPLTERQVEYLLTLKEGPEFTKKMGEILDDNQLLAIKNASGSRGRSGGRRRR